jgi:uncharacterized protein
MKDKRIVVVGVSHKEDKFGYRIFKGLLDKGFKVEGVNPTDGEIAGKKIFRSLADVPGQIDMVITVVNASVTEQVVEQCRQLNIPEIWMQPGSESEKAINQAEKYGIAVIHDACFMVEQGVW